MTPNREPDAGGLASRDPVANARGDGGRWLSWFAVAVIVGMQAGTIFKPLGSIGDTRLADWIDLATPFAVLGCAVMALHRAHSDRTPWTLLFAGGVTFALGHGLHLAANSISNVDDQAVAKRRSCTFGTRSRAITWGPVGSIWCSSPSFGRWHPLDPVARHRVAWRRRRSGHPREHLHRRRRCVVRPRHFRKRRRGGSELTTPIGDSRFDQRHRTAPPRRLGTVLVRNRRHGLPGVQRRRLDLVISSFHRSAAPPDNRRSRALLAVPEPAPESRGSEHARHRPLSAPRIRSSPLATRGPTVRLRDRPNAALRCLILSGSRCRRSLLRCRSTMRARPGLPARHRVLGPEHRKVVLNSNARVSRTQSSGIGPIPAQ